MLLWKNKFRRLKMKRKTWMQMMVLAVVMFFMTAAAMAEVPKYVFFFLGDGMANSQIQATEAYLTTVNGGEGDFSGRPAQTRKPAEHVQDAGHRDADHL
jgi:alkaline phosphatase